MTAKTNNWAERNAAAAKEELDFKTNLEREHGLTGHPKADLLWRLAWEDGHSGGWDDIASVYSEFAELLKP